MEDKLKERHSVEETIQDTMLFTLEKLQDAEELVKVLMDATPFGVIFIDENLGVVDCNMSAVRLKGMSSKAEFLERYLDLFPLRQPDGTFSMDSMRKHRATAFKEGHHKFQWTYKLLNGEDLLVEYTLKRVLWKDGYRIVGFSRDLREIEKLDNEAKIANERSRIMVEKAPIACHFFDENGHIVDCNKVALEMLGAESIEEFGFCFEDFNPEYQANGRKSSEQALEKFDTIKDNGSLRFEWIRKHKNGKTIPVQVTAYRIRHKDGYQIVSYERDLSAIRNAEVRAKILLDKNPLISSLWDFDGNIIECNAEALRVLGVKDTAEYAEGFATFLNPEFQPDGERSSEKGKRLIQQTFEKGTQKFDWLYLNKAGEEVPVETTLIRVDTFEGTQLVAYSRDLREIQKHQEQAQEAQRLTQAMLNEGPYSIVVIDEFGSIIECNEAAVRLYGATDKNDLINNFFDKYIVGDKEEVIKEVKEVAKLQIAPNTCENLIKHSSGEIIPVEVSYRKIPWVGNKKRTLVYGNDIRELKSKMREIEETNVNLIKAKNVAEEAEQELRKKSLLLETVNSVAARLLPTDDCDIDENIHKSLDELAHAADLDEITIYKIVEHEGKQWYQFYTEYASDYKHDDRLNSFDNIPLWKEKILNREMVNVSISSLDKKHQKYFANVKIKGVLAIPLIVMDKLWGFISYNDCTRERDFSESQVKTLCSASTILISAIHRSTTRELIDVNNNLVNVKNLMSAVNKVSEIIITDSMNDSAKVTLESLRLISDGVGASGMSLWQNHVDVDGIVSRRLFGYVENGKISDGGLSTAINLKNRFPEWTSGGKIETIEVIKGKDNGSSSDVKFLRKAEYLMFVPLHVGDKFWGFVAISKDSTDQLFTDEEKNIIQSGSLMIAEYIISADLTMHLDMAERSAATDGLTGLINRSAFDVRSEMMFHHSKMYQEYISIMFLDLDHFKHVNDNYGHVFGDEVLKRFAEILKTSLRPNDLCARYGGEEFVIVLADTCEEEATIIAERIMDTVRQTRFKEEKGFRFTVSIGLKSGIPTDEDMIQQYIDNADQAVYKAKETGRNKLVNFKEI